MTRGAAPAALLAFSTTAALSLTACGGNVDRKDLESKIATYVRQQTGASVDIHCPDGVKATSGARVRCTTSLSGAETEITIQFDGDDGRFHIAATQLR